VSYRIQFVACRAFAELANNRLIMLIVTDKRSILADSIACSIYFIKLFGKRRDIFIPKKQKNQNKKARACGDRDAKKISW